MLRPNLFIPRLNLGCVFQLQKFKADGTITYTGPRFSNIVLNTGLDLMASKGPHGQVNGGLNYCNVGSGAKREVVSDTGLLDFTAGTDNVTSTETYYSSGVGYDYPAWRSWRQVFEFGVGEITDTISEIGLSNSLNSGYYNRHRIVDPRGVHIGLDILEDEGLIVWTDSYVFGCADVGDQINADFIFHDVSGDISMGCTWTQLEGWLTESGIVIGDVPASDIRILKSIPTIDPNAGTPADYVVDPYTNGDAYRDVKAVWKGGTLSGDYIGLMANISGVTYGRFDFDAPITMSDEEVSLHLTVRRDWGRTSQEGVWI